MFEHFCDLKMFIFCLCLGVITEQSRFCLVCHDHRVALADVDVL